MWNIKQLFNSSRNIANQESINSFYDSVANEYEKQLNDSDRMAREEISLIFKSHIKTGTVLDFGGGTGLDLQWLLPSGYKTLSFEPSTKMRDIAKNKYSEEKNISFVEKELDFSKWSNDRLPFTEKVDAVLANFGTLNCIKNIDLFFEQMALVANRNSIIIAAIIDPRPKSIIKNYSVLTALRLIYKRELTVLNQYNSMYHETYLHSLRSLKRASRKHFGFKSFFPIKFSTFVVIVLSRK